MKLRVVIVDDEPLAKDLLSAILEDDGQIDVVAVCMDGETAIEAVLRERPDLVFLDIEMPEMSGLEVAANLIEKMRPDDLPHIIFATAYSHYAVEAFRVNALDYVLKPLEDSVIATSLQRVRKTLAQAGRRDGTAIAKGVANLGHIHLRDGDRIVLMPPEDIFWIEAQGDYVAIHLQTGQRLIRATLKSVEADLPIERFQRVHRSSILNIQALREVVPAASGGATAILSNGHQLSVSRAYRRKLDQRLT